MPWHNEERYRRAKRIWHTSEPERYRVSCSIAALHYESILDSGSFDTEVDMRSEDFTGSRLAGERITGAGYEFALQKGLGTGQRKPRGAIGFGGRRGEHFVNLIPRQIGYLNTRTRGFQRMFGAPDLTSPVIQTHQKTFGFPNDDDPISWNINVGATANFGDIWTMPNGGSVDYHVKIKGGQIEPVFTVNALARQWIAVNEAPRDLLSEATFGVLMEIDFNDIPRVEHRGNRKNLGGDDFDFDEDLVLRNSAGRRIAEFGMGGIVVKNRGGRVPIVKRMWRQGNRWFFFMGANTAQMRDNLLDGDLIIDPPISEESIAANADDAQQYGGSTMNLSGIGGAANIYLGNEANYYHGGWRFQTVPIANGATVNSATLEPLQDDVTQAGTAATIYGDDTDDAPAFTTTANDITSRTRTTATGTASMPGDNNRASWDVASIVAEIVGRAGWSSNNALAFPVISTNAGAAYTGFDDYSTGAANAADFNADVTGGGAAANPKGPFGLALHGPFGGPIG